MYKHFHDIILTDNSQQITEKRPHVPQRS